MSREHKLIFVGDSKKRHYVGGGIDDKKDYSINCQVNDTIYVTEEKKAELLKDHGHWFKDPDAVEVKQPESESKIKPKVEKPEPPPSVARKEGKQPVKVKEVPLLKRKMPELHKIAKKLKIKVPFGTSKEALVELIESKESKE